MTATNNPALARRLGALAILIALALVASACAKKKAPQTVADRPAPVRATPEPRREAPAPVPAAAPAEVDIWSSDLDTLNAYIQSQGLLQNAYFDTDRHELRPDAQEVLYQNSRFLLQHPQLLIQIEGHCDERETNEYNLGLGDRRAHEVRRYLASLGVPLARMEVLSYGEERPICSESHEGCWWRNRRAHFLVTGRTSTS